MLSFSFDIIYSVFLEVQQHTVGQDHVTVVGCDRGLSTRRYGAKVVAMLSKGIHKKNEMVSVYIYSNMSSLNELKLIKCN